MSTAARPTLVIARAKHASTLSTHTLTIRTLRRIGFIRSLLVISIP
jgi:hypothetical protein